MMVAATAMLRRACAPRFPMEQVVAPHPLDDLLRTAGPPTVQRPFKLAESAEFHRVEAERLYRLRSLPLMRYEWRHDCLGLLNEEMVAVSTPGGEVVARKTTRAYW